MPPPPQPDDPTGDQTNPQTNPQTPPSPPAGSVRRTTSTTSRRGFLGWMTRLGAAVIGGIAGVDALQRPAGAQTPTQRRPQYVSCHQEACCCLASYNDCGGGANFRCPPGYSKRVWYCCTHSTTRKVYGCGECTNGSTCSNGTAYACSTFWATGDIC